MTKSGNYYNQPPMALTLADVKKYASDKNQFCCKDMPLLNVPLCNIVLDELHLLLRVTDILLSNLIEDAMELDDKNDFLKKKGEPKGVYLQRLTQLINSCGVTFSVWEKRDDHGKEIGNMDWTSLMGAEKKKLLHTLPDKLQSSTEEIIHLDTAGTVIKLWKVCLSDTSFSLICPYVSEESESLLIGSPNKRFEGTKSLKTLETCLTMN